MAGTSSAPLGEQLAHAMAAANILGRLTVLRDCRRKTAAPLDFNASSSLQQFSDSAGDTGLSIYSTFDLPNVKAIDYLRDLTPVTRSVFDGLTAQYKADAFTLAGVSDQRILNRIQDQLVGVTAAGGTPADFRRAVNAVKSDAGVEQLAGPDLDQVFQGYTQRAYSAGRYEQMTDESVMDALPYWQYWTVGDDRVRPEHAVLDHFCALGIDPVWKKIYPPCGYGCRCSVVCLAKSEAPIGSDEGGLLRLPVLAIAKVPQPGFQGIFPIAA